MLARVDKQLQPFEKVDDKIKPKQMVMSIKELSNISRKVELSKQHCSVDPEYQNIFSDMLHWRPSQYLLDEIQNGKVLFPFEPTCEQLLETLFQYPNGTVSFAKSGKQNKLRYFK